VPFEVESLYSIPDSENRAQLYYRIAFCLEASAHIPRSLDVHWNTEALSDFQTDRDLDKRTRATKKALRDLKKLKLRVKYIRKSQRRFFPPLSKNQKGKAKEILGDLQWVLDELKIAAQARDACFFPRLFEDPLACYGKAEIIENFDEIVLLRLLAIEKNDIDLISSLLQFSVDQIPLNHHNIHQLKLEEIALQGFVSQYLDNAKSEKEVVDLIAVLNNYHSQRRKLKTGLEFCKSRFLSSVHRWINLSDPLYKGSLENHKLISFSRPPELLWLNTFPVDSTANKRPNAIKHLAKLKENEAANFSETEMEMLKKLERDFAREKIDFFAMTSMMTAADFAREIKIERQRYQEFEDTFAIENVDDQEEQIRKLEAVWTLDGSWKASPLRLLSRPRHIAYKPSFQSYLFSMRAAIAMAAAVKFRLGNDGKNPADLQEAFSFAGLGEVPTDPFTGKPFQLRIVGDRIGIFAEDTERIPFATGI